MFQPEASSQAYKVSAAQAPPPDTSTTIFIGWRRSKSLPEKKQGWEQQHLFSVAGFEGLSIVGPYYHKLVHNVNS